MRLILSFVLLLLTLPATAQTIATPAQLIAAMHARYTDSWYHTLTFEQQSITHKSDGADSTELWHEALMLPGRLRIDIGEPDSGHGLLFANDRIYVFRESKLANERDYIHPLLVLGFDVYRQPVDKTMQQLKALNFDLSAMHEDTLEGRAMYVVGAKAGDMRTPQFWIDKERLYFVRQIKPDDKDPATTQDVRFADYKQVTGGGWLAEHVLLYSGGKLVFEEKYSSIRVDPELNEALFDPQRFFSARSTLAK